MWLYRLNNLPRKYTKRYKGIADGRDNRNDVKSGTTRIMETLPIISVNNDSKALIKTDILVLRTCTYIYIYSKENDDPRK